MTGAAAALDFQKMRHFGRRGFGRFDRSFGSQVSPASMMMNENGDQFQISSSIRVAARLLGLVSHAA